MADETEILQSYNYDIEIIADNGALTTLPSPANAVIEVAVDPGPPMEVQVPGTQGPPGDPGLVKVTHGSNPNVPRPDAPLVYWVGTVQPLYADPDDLLMLKGT